MSTRKELLSITATLLAIGATKFIVDHLSEENEQKQLAEINKKKAEDLIAYTKKINGANKLINEESNRLITWSLSVIGGSILAMISTSYIRPTGIFLDFYLLFPVGWILLGISLFYGEMATRIYIAGATVSDDNIDGIKKIGLEVDRKFSKQLFFLQLGMIAFFLWLLSYLTWSIFVKSN